MVLCILGGQGIEVVLTGLSLGSVWGVSTMASVRVSLYSLYWGRELARKAT